MSVMWQNHSIAIVFDDASIGGTRCSRTATFSQGSHREQNEEIIFHG